MSAMSPIPGISGGILRPKLSHHFVVRFLVQADVSAAEVKQIENHLTALSLQTVSLKLPTRSFEGLMPLPGEGKLKNVKMDGPLIVTFEDDITSTAVNALEWLASNPALTIVVMKLDGEEKVRNAYRFSKAHLSSYDHSLLDYASPHISQINGKITSIVEGEPQAATVSLSAGTCGAGCSYTAKFNFKAAQFGSFSTPIEMKDLL